MIKRLIQTLSKRFKRKPPHTIKHHAGTVCTIYQTREFGIDYQQIDYQAIKVVKRLQQAGFEAYLVGGCVRDLIAGMSPKDFDVATNAHPNQIQEVFGRQCRIIGKRFKLAHVRFGRYLVEVATFRGDHSQPHPHRITNEQGRLERDNIYGTLEEDVFRRDFTVNALYLDPVKRTIVDFTDGVKDIQRKRIRMIGEPLIRIKEDPVRMIRAHRFEIKCGFGIDKTLHKTIAQNRHLLKDIAAARLFDEVFKYAHSTAARQQIFNLETAGFLSLLLPATHEALSPSSAHSKHYRQLLDAALENTEKRLMNHLGVNPAFLMAVFLWPAYQQTRDRLIEQGQHFFPAAQAATRWCIEQQQVATQIPKRFVFQIQDILLMQDRFEQAKFKKHYLQLSSHERFRAAYDFMCLRAQVDNHNPVLVDCCQWWTQWQLGNEVEQQHMINERCDNNASKRNDAVVMPKKHRQHRHRRRRRPRSDSH